MASFPTLPDAALPLAADGVSLGLADRLEPARSPGELAEPASWLLQQEAFPGYVGPFSALELLAGGQALEGAVGPHPHCVSPPVPAPEAVAQLRGSAPSHARWAAAWSGSPLTGSSGPTVRCTRSRSICTSHEASLAAATETEGTETLIPDRCPTASSIRPLGWCRSTPGGGPLGDSGAVAASV